MTEGTAASRKRKLLRGPRRKDEQKDALRADRPALHVDLCQILPLDEENALLRVAGRWSVPVPPDVPGLVGRAALVAPLPPGAGIDRAGLWSAGFEVSAEAAEADLALV